MEAVTLRFPLDESIAAGARLAVFGDGGSGTIDYSAPISDTFEAWPRECYRVSWLGHRWLRHRWLRATSSAGWLRGLWLGHKFLRYQDTAVFNGGYLYGPVGDGPHRFAAVLYDERGRTSGNSPPELEISLNTYPRPIFNFTPSAMTSGRMTFTFTPSADL
jgi:hypothetical protein